MFVKIWTLRSEEHVTMHLNISFFKFSGFFVNKGGNKIGDFSRIFDGLDFITELCLFVSLNISNLTFLLSFSSDSFDEIDSFKRGVNGLDFIFPIDILSSFSFVSSL